MAKLTFTSIYNMAKLTFSTENNIYTVLNSPVSF